MEPPVIAPNDRFALRIQGNFDRIVFDYCLDGRPGSVVLTRPFYLSLITNMENMSPQEKRMEFRKVVGSIEGYKPGPEIAGDII